MKWFGKQSYALFSIETVSSIEKKNTLAYHYRFLVLLLCVIFIYFTYKYSISVAKTTCSRGRQHFIRQKGKKSNQEMVCFPRTDILHINFVKYII